MSINLERITIEVIELVDIEEEVRKYLNDSLESYISYFNPCEDDIVIVHLLGESNEVLLTFCMYEDGSLIDIYD